MMHELFAMVKGRVPGRHGGLHIYVPIIEHFYNVYAGRTFSSLEKVLDPGKEQEHVLAIRLAMTSQKFQEDVRKCE
jgi:hypothetical protein